MNLIFFLRKSNFEIYKNDCLIIWYGMGISFGGTVVVVFDLGRKRICHMCYGIRARYPLAAAARELVSNNMSSMLSIRLREVTARAFERGW